MFGCVPVREMTSFLWVSYMYMYVQASVELAFLVMCTCAVLFRNGWIVCPTTYTVHVCFIGNGAVGLNSMYSTFLVYM